MEDFDADLYPPGVEIAGGWTRESIEFGCNAQAETRESGHDSVPVTLWYPTNADAVVEQQIEMGNEDDPFWCYLWPTARTLAKQVFGAARSRLTPAPLIDGVPPSPGATLSLNVLETGCGIGLVGLACLAAGATTVTFQDLRSRSVALALHNARINGMGDRALGETVDWRSPTHHRFDWIIASDILYHAPAHKSLLNFLTETLAPTRWSSSDGDSDGDSGGDSGGDSNGDSNGDSGGDSDGDNAFSLSLSNLNIHRSIWIGDPGRREAEAFIQLAQSCFHVYLFDESGLALSSPMQGQYQLIVLSPDIM